MESRAQHSRNNSRLILRVPTRTFRLSRSHHPYKRVSYINCSPEPNDDLFGQDFNRFLEAVQLLPPVHQNQDNHQLLHHEQENQREDHGNEHGNVEIQLEPVARRTVSTVCFLKCLFIFIPVVILIIISRLLDA